MTLIWSYGGGVQTAAIGVLVATGKLPRPDAVVMADTGREATATWDYLREAMGPYLRREVGLEVAIAPHGLATVDLYSGNGDLLIPAFTTDGKLPGLCSVEWKRRVVRRWLKAQGYDDVTLWLGISTDEAHRAKDSDVQWLRHEYPLLYLAPMNRAECVGLVQRAGLPTPPRSSCWMCPYRGPAEWVALQSSGDWDKAVALDAEIRERDPDVFLHRSRQPLGDVVLAASKQISLDLCDGGQCWT